jgi:hypothetical protein
LTGDRDEALAAAVAAAEEAARVPAADKRLAA